MAMKFFENSKILPFHGINSEFNHNAVLVQHGRRLWTYWICLNSRFSKGQVYFSLKLIEKEGKLDARKGDGPRCWESGRSLVVISKSVRLHYSCESKYMVQTNQNWLWKRLEVNGPRKWKVLNQYLDGRRCWTLMVNDVKTRSLKSFGPKNKNERLKWSKQKRSVFWIMNWAAFGVERDWKLFLLTNEFWPLRPSSFQSGIPEVK